MCVQFYTYIRMLYSVLSYAFHLLYHGEHSISVFYHQPPYILSVNIYHMHTTSSVHNEFQWKISKFPGFLIIKLYNQCQYTCIYAHMSKYIHIKFLEVKRSDQEASLFFETDYVPFSVIKR